MGNGMEAGPRRGAPRRLCEVCRGLGWYAQEAMGGGIFALRRLPPLQSALRGGRCGEWLCPTFTPRRASTGNDVKADNDAARRAATYLENRENRF